MRRREGKKKKPWGLARRVSVRSRDAPGGPRPAVLAGRGLRQLTGRPVPDAWAGWFRGARPGRASEREGRGGERGTDRSPAPRMPLNATHPYSRSPSSRSWTMAAGRERACACVTKERAWAREREREREGSAGAGAHALALGGLTSRSRGDLPCAARPGFPHNTRCHTHIHKHTPPSRTQHHNRHLSLSLSPFPLSPSLSFTFWPSSASARACHPPCASPRRRPWAPPSWAAAPASSSA